VAHPVSGATPGALSPYSLFATLQVGLQRLDVRAVDEDAGAVARSLLDYLGLPTVSGDETAGQCVLRTAASLPSPPAGASAPARYDDFDFSLWRLGHVFFLLSPTIAVTVDPGRGEAHATLLAGAPVRGDTFAILTLALCALLRPHGLLPLHAAGLVRAGEGVLISAHSGAGKSTLALALVRQGWGFLSDDALLLEERGSGIEALPFRRTFGLLPETLAWLSVPGGTWTPHPSDGRKRSVPLADLLPEQAVERCRPSVLVFPQILDTPASRLQPLRPAEALTRLMRQSGLITLDPGWTREHMAVLGRLVAQARSYRLLAGRDVLESPGQVSRLLESAL